VTSRTRFSVQSISKSYTAGAVLKAMEHLYVDWNGATKLAQYQPALFFTSDEESLEFDADWMLLWNQPYFRERSASNSG